jgi:dynamin family protein
VIDPGGGAEIATSNIISYYIRRLLTSCGIGPVSAGAGHDDEAKAGSEIGSDDTEGRQPDQPAMGAEGRMAGFEPASLQLAGFQRSWSGPAPRVALVGEFSAGKSSIINLLLGRDMIPTAVLASTRRPTLLRHAPNPQIEAIADDGKRELVTPDSVEIVARDDINHFDIGLPNELLRSIELIDTPGFADPDREPRRTLEMINRADICLWCTLATQAWRNSERQTWLSLPARFRTHGILVATHIDTLAERGARKKIRTRLQREAGDLFGEIVLLSVPDAKRASKPDGRVTDPTLWRDSGGEALIGALQRAANKHGETSQQTAGADDVKEPAPARDEIAPAASSAVAAEADAAQAGEMAASGTESDAAMVPGTAAALQNFLAKVMNTVPGCLSAAWIDLSERRVLELRGFEADDEAASQPLGNAIAELFQGGRVRAIEAVFKRSRGVAEDETHYFREIVIVADGCVGILLRDRSRADRSLVVVTDKAVNLGMALATTRGLLGSTADLI